MEKPDQQAATRHRGRWRGALLALSAAALFLTGWLWGFEIWMLPEFLKNRITTLQPIACAIGISGILTWALWCRDGRWLRVAGTCVTMAAVLFSLRWSGGMLAVAALTKDDQLYGDSTQHDPVIWKKIETAVKASGMTVPKWLEKKTESKWIENPRVEHLLECSRWPVRARFVKRTMKNPKQALALGERWNEFFPAVTGADVEYRNRRNLMGILDRIRRDPTTLNEARSTAILWMGFVVLTDPPEFSAWREKIRDAMIQCPNPVPGNRCDGWMRAMDVLLAFDPPENWAELTQPLTTDPDVLRRAVRQRVRGMASHVDAIITEARAAENAGDDRAAFALWQDTGRLIDAYPEIPPAIRLTEWRHTTLCRWLTTQRPGWFQDLFLPHESSMTSLFDNPDMVVSPAEEQVILQRALEIADDAVLFANSADSDKRASAAYYAHIDHLQVLHAFLSDASRQTLARKIGPVIVRLPLLADHRGKSGEWINPPWRMTTFLIDLWPLLPQECREAYGRHFRDYWKHAIPYPALLCMAAWSGTCTLSEDEWILSALYWGRNYGNTPFQEVDPSAVPGRIPHQMPYPIPRIPRAAIDSIIGRFRMAPPPPLSSRDWSTWWTSLQLNDEAAPLPARLRAFVPDMLSRGRDITIPDSIKIPPGEISVRLTLHAAGLLEPDDRLTEVLFSHANWNSASYFLHPEDLQNSWSTVLESPANTEYFVRQARIQSTEFRSFLDALLAAPAAPEIMQTVWQILRDRSHVEELDSRLEAYGAMFRLSPRVSASARCQMRAEFLHLFGSTTIPRRFWPVDAMEPAGFKRLAWPGEGIPWEDDALSAALSWSSEIKAETTLIPGYGVPETRTGVFSYLAQAFVSYIDEGPGGVFVDGIDVRTPVEQSLWKRAPLRLPLEATPWQRARALHLRRPDLKWPDRTWLRPVGRND